MKSKRKNKILLICIFMICMLLAFLSTEQLKLTYARWRLSPFYENQWKACEAILKEK